MTRSDVCSWLWNSLLVTDRHGNKCVHKLNLGLLKREQEYLRNISADCLQPTWQRFSGILGGKLILLWCGWRVLESRVRGIRECVWMDAQPSKIKTPLLQFRKIIWLSLHKRKRKKVCRSKHERFWHCKLHCYFYVWVCVFVEVHVSLCVYALQKFNFFLEHCWTATSFWVIPPNLKGKDV